MTESLPTSRGERYEVQSLLGRGGMGVVYAAFDKQRGHVLALKCLSVERFTTAKQRERAVALFEREYHALSQLTHPHIIEAYDYGRDEQGPYYTMEKLSGESLRARAPMPWQIVCALVRDIVSALALLHSRSLVHRDLTPLNIYCTPDRRAKLIDFGAMMQAGVAKHLVGTPAFTAPECLQQQSLDGQADLYSLGGCLYFAITGQHAYPARSFEALHEIWETAPRPLAMFSPDVPKALEELVQSLLSLDPSDRPRTAAEVYERLTVIANLPRDEVRGTAQSYLTKPSLVGRDVQLAVLADAAQRTAAGTGRSLLVRGVRGVGRSRLLDAAVLEAKLCGMRVARADAATSQVSTLGVARSLFAALAPDNPALQTLMQTLGLEDVSGDDFAKQLESEARERTLRELSRALLDACKLAPHALVVDDVHAIDEPSRALLADLAAQVHEHPLLIVSSMDRDAPLPSGTAGALLSEYSRRVDLSALSEPESRALLVSMLGDVPNVDVLTMVSYRRCQGNPQLLMEATRSLIEQRLLRYEGGQWLISGTADKLAATIDDERGLGPRLQRLSADALELLQAVAFDEYQIMDLASYLQLLSHGDSRRMHRALSELVDARWVELHEDKLRLARDNLRRSLAENVPSARRRELHSRVADQCVKVGLPAVYEAYYRLGADQPVAAVAALDVFSVFVDQHPRTEFLRHTVTLAVTDAVSRLPDLAGVHPAMRAKYMTVTVLNAMTYRGLPEFAASRLTPALQLIAPFSGMADYRELSNLPPQERLTRALTLASARCAVPGFGAMDVIYALRSQTQLCIAGALAANFMCDAELLNAIPDLTPFLVLSPVLVIATRVVDALSQLVRGQTWLAWESLRAAYTELNGPLAEQIDPLTRDALHGVALGYLAALHADHGADGALPLIDEFGRYMPSHVEAHRSRFCLALGDLTAAAAARRRYEVLSVRMGSSSVDARNVELPVHLTIYALCGDSIGLRRTHLALQDVAKTRDGWQGRAALAHAQLLRCQGMVADGLNVIEPLMSKLDVSSVDWHQAAAAHLELLCAAKRYDEVVEIGRDYVSRARAGQVPDYRIELALAPACAELGDHDAAEEHFGHALAQLEDHKCAGVLTGVALEIGARLALARGDSACFDSRAEACAAQFRLGKHPALTARYNALMRDASRTGRRLHPSLPPTYTIGGSDGDSRLQSLQRLAGQPIDDSMFYRAILDVLLEQAGAVGGVLYVQRQGSLLRVASAGGLAARPELDAFASRYLEQSVARDLESTTASEAQPVLDGVGVYLIEHGVGAALTIEGIALLDVGTVITRAPIAHARLGSLASVMAERARARSMLGGSISQTESTQAKSISRDAPATEAAEITITRDE